MQTLKDFLIRLINKIQFGSPTFGGVPRSPKWEETRKAHLKKEPLCQCCGTKGSLLAPNEVHHVAPYHLHPELELEDSNLITFCRPHHLLFGHLMSWPSFNKNVREDAALWRTKIAQRP